MTAPFALSLSKGDRLTTNGQAHYGEEAAPPQEPLLQHPAL